MKSTALFVAVFVATFSVGGLSFVIFDEIQNEPYAHAALVNTEQVIFDSTVKIEVDGGHGTATIGIWDGKVLAVTAGHVIRFGERGKLRMERGGVTYLLDTTCIARDDENDVSICNVENPPPFPYPSLDPVTDNLVAGEEAMQCGYPLCFQKVLDKVRVLNGGHLGEPNSPWRRAPVFYVNGVGAPGSSGSAVWVLRGGFLRDYRLAGIHVGGYGPGYSHTPKVCIQASVIRAVLVRATNPQPIVLYIRPQGR